MPIHHLLFGTLGLDAAAWLQMFLHFLALSLLAVGGAITTAPDMHRFVVREKGWLSDADFTASVALAQAAPGPNLLYVAVIGFNIAGLAGVLATMLGTLLPSTALALAASRYSSRHQSSRAVRAFTTGMAPLTIGLLLASSWILLEPTREAAGVGAGVGIGINAGGWTAIALVALTLLVMSKTKVSPLWPMALGAVLGVLGWV
jgi:chromate transporter